jgi:hypothetical protein
MNFLGHSSRVRDFAFAVIIWATGLLASDLDQNNPPVRCPDTPVVICDIDPNLPNDYACARVLCMYGPRKSHVMRPTSGGGPEKHVCQGETTVPR